jgi:glycosyltransferase involved in cell wall biosynthesis
MKPSRILFLGSQPPEKGGIASHLRDMGNISQDYIGFDVRQRFGFLKLVWFLWGKKVDLISAYHLYEGLHAFLTGKKYALTVFGEMYTEKRWWHSLVLRNANKVFATSQYCARPARDMGIDVKVIPYGVDTEHFRPENPHKAYDVLFVGYIHPRMGIDCFLRACKEGITYALVGENNSIAGLVSFNVNYDNLPAWYRDSRIYVSCANTKSPCMGLAIKEAMACGLPVIAADSGGVSEAVKHGYNGFLFEPDNDKQLREYILMLLNDPKLANKMGMNGREMVEIQFDKNKQCLEVLHELNSPD